MSGSGARTRKPPKRLQVHLGTSKTYDVPTTGTPKRARSAAASSAAAVAAPAATAASALIPLTDVAFGEILGALANDKTGETLLLAKIARFDLTTWGSVTANTTSKRGKKYRDDILTYALKLQNPWPFTVLIDAGVNVTVAHLELIAKGKRRPDFITKAIDSLTAQQIAIPFLLRQELAKKYPEIVAAPTATVSVSEPVRVDADDEEDSASVSSYHSETISEPQHLTEQDYAVMQFMSTVEHGYLHYAAEFDFFCDAVKDLQLDQILPSFISLLISNGFYKDYLWRLIKEFDKGSQGADKCFREVFPRHFDVYEQESTATYSRERELRTVLHEAISAISNDQINTNVDFVQYRSTTLDAITAYDRQAYRERKDDLMLYSTKLIPESTSTFKTNCKQIREFSEVVQSRLNKLRSLVELIDDLQQEYLDDVHAALDELENAHGAKFDATSVLSAYCPEVLERMQQHKSVKADLLSNVAHFLNDVGAWYEQYRSRIIDRPVSPRPTSTSFAAPLRFSVQATQTSMSVTTSVTVAEFSVRPKPGF